MHYWLTGEYIVIELNKNKIKIFLIKKGLLALFN